ncbi:MAG TPA: hypothetical protein VM779_10990 [Thermoanaerobaculia bacterium]|nr:hypothetical protein [Thermoanaerobaculia bacterium]
MHDLFKQHGGRGAVFHYDSEYAGHGKFFVILNDVWPPPDGVIVYAYTTSQVDRFADGGIPESMIVRLQPRDYSFSPKETVIDLTAVRAKAADEFSNRAMFKFVCNLSDDDVKRVDDAVMASTRIVRKHKKAILGARYG